MQVRTLLIPTVLIFPKTKVTSVPPFTQANEYANHSRAKGQTSERKSSHCLTDMTSVCPPECPCHPHTCPLQ